MYFTHLTNRICNCSRDKSFSLQIKKSFFFTWFHCPRWSMIPYNCHVIQNSFKTSKPWKVIYDLLWFPCSQFAHNLCRRLHKEWSKPLKFESRLKKINSQILCLQTTTTSFKAFQLIFLHWIGWVVIKEKNTSLAEKAILQNGSTQQRYEFL